MFKHLPYFSCTLLIYPLLECSVRKISQIRSIVRSCPGPLYSLAGQEGYLSPSLLITLPPPLETLDPPLYWIQWECVKIFWRPVGLQFLYLVVTHFSTWYKTTAIILWHLIGAYTSQEWCWTWKLCDYTFISLNSLANLMKWSEICFII